MKRQRVLVWFRQDLRLHDNEALTDALKSGIEVIPIYVFDERVFKGKTQFDFPKTAKFRAKFILESVEDLRASLRSLGSELIVRVGKPEDEIYKIAQQVKSSWVFCNRERTREEVAVQDALERNLWSIGQEVIFSRGKMLYYTQDLPFPVTHTPDAFTQFKKEVERIVPVREPLPAPTAADFNPLTIELEAGEMPELKDFGWEAFTTDDRSAFEFVGGETEGLARLQHFVWEAERLQNYKTTCSGLMGEDYSSKFSAWLSQGCLSPKMIYQELKKYEQETGANKSSYHLFLELLWRDFYRLMGKKYDELIFQKGGIKGEVDERWKDDYRLLQLWKEGRTGVPFIDANMKELLHTGFMSNRGRQNVASFLVKDLNVNWQMGASYFESMLIDYDPCSNWGNWNYIAGVDSDPRDDRYLNILVQAKRFDPKGEYVKRWLPELVDVPVNKIHRPDTLTVEEQTASQIKIGASYPKAMVNTRRWA